MAVTAVLHPMTSEWAVAAVLRGIKGNRLKSSIQEMSRMGAKAVQTREPPRVNPRSENMRVRQAARGVDPVARARVAITRSLNSPWS
jgi:hypothetical protein